jgi:hypothetical protein
METKITDYYFSRGMNVKKMRVAYLFTGHMRAFEDTHVAFFENLFSVAPGDIYIHTWDTLSQTHPCGFKSASTQPKLDIERVKKIYKPRAIMVEPQSAPITCTYKGKRMDNALAKTHESSLKAWLLSTHTRIYDRYFWVRGDILFRSKLSLDELQDTKSCYVPLFDIPHLCESICATWWSGNAIHSEHMAMMYWHLEEFIYYNINRENTGFKYVEDAMSQYYFQCDEIKNNLKISQMDWAVVRGAYEPTGRRLDVMDGNIKHFDDIKLFKELIKGRKVVQFGALDRFGEIIHDLIVRSGGIVTGVCDHNVVGNLFRNHTVQRISEMGDLTDELVVIGEMGNPWAQIFTQIAKYYHPKAIVLSFQNIREVAKILSPAECYEIKEIPPVEEPGEVNQEAVDDLLARLEGKPKFRAGDKARCLQSGNIGLTYHEIYDVEEDSRMVDGAEMVRIKHRGDYHAAIFEVEK